MDGNIQNRQSSAAVLSATPLHQFGILSVLVSYAPTEDSPDEDKDLFYDQLESAIMSVPQHDQLILLVVVVNA